MAVTRTTTIESGQRTYISAKTLPPQAPAALIAREKFNDLSHETDPVSLVLIHARAGYGKITTL